MVIQNTYPNLSNIVHTDFELGRVIQTVTAADCGITAERTDCARLSRFVRPHRRAPPPNYSKTSRFPTHSAIRLVGQSSFATPALSSSAPGLSGSHPLRDLLLRLLLPIACLTGLSG